MLKHLVPFAFATAIYFCLLPFEKTSFWDLFFKCFPIYSLAAAVYWQQNKTSKSNFGKLLIYGLLSSSIGDAFLVWQDFFPLGMVAFAVAHYFYIKAFGFKPLKPLIGLVLYALAGIILFYILPNIRDIVIFYGMPVYALFLVTMSWRALARATHGLDAWSWPKTACAIGSIFFVISDTIICFHDLQNPIPYGRILIMSTYYAAQLGIAFSIKSDTHREISSKSKKK